MFNVQSRMTLRLCSSSSATAQTRYGGTSPGPLLRLRSEEGDGVGICRVSSDNSTELPGRASRIQPSLAGLGKDSGLPGTNVPGYSRLPRWGKGAGSVAFRRINRKRAAAWRRSAETPLRSWRCPPRHPPTRGRYGVTSLGSYPDIGCRGNCRYPDSVAFRRIIQGGYYVRPGMELLPAFCRRPLRHVKWLIINSVTDCYGL